MYDTVTEGESPPRKSARHEADGITSRPSGTGVTGNRSASHGAQHLLLSDSTTTSVRTTHTPDASTTLLSTFPDVCMQDASINGILAMSGPRGGGAIDAQSAQSSLTALRLAVNDPIYCAIADAWDKVLVPAEQYWGILPSCSAAGSRNEARRVAAAEAPPGRKQEAGMSNMELGSSQAGVRGVAELNSPFAAVHATIGDTRHNINSTVTNSDSNSGNMSSIHDISSSHINRDGSNYDMCVKDVTSGYAQTAPVAARIPDPRHLSLTFYGSRTEAMAGRGYEPNRGNVVVAVDRRYGNSSKLFNILPRADHAHSSSTCVYHNEHMREQNGANNSDGNSASVPRLYTHAQKIGHSSDLAAFIRAIPHEHDRNMYVLVDETTAIDPYFDIDCRYTAQRASAQGGGGGGSSSANPAGTTCIAQGMHDRKTDSTSVTDEAKPFHWSCIDVDHSHRPTEVSSSSPHRTPELASAQKCDGLGSNNHRCDNDYTDSRDTCDVKWQQCDATPAAVRADVEATLVSILSFLKTELETHLHTQLSQCLVLTSSVQIWRRTEPEGSTDTPDNSSSKNSSDSDNDTTESVESTHDTESLSCTHSSSRLLELKLSLHVHFRLHNNHALQTVKEMHQLMSHVRERLDARLAQQSISPAPDHTPLSPDGTTHHSSSTMPLHVHHANSRSDACQSTSTDTSAYADVHVCRAVRRCVDFGVYTRWRAFRLPYNVKSPLLSVQHTLKTANPARDAFLYHKNNSGNNEDDSSNSNTAQVTVARSAIASGASAAQINRSERNTKAGSSDDIIENSDIFVTTGAGLTAVDAAVDDLLRGQIEELDIVLPRIDVGEVAQNVMPSVELSSDPKVFVEQCRLLRKLFHYFRFFLPLVPSVTHIASTALRQFLEQYHFCPCVALSSSKTNTTMNDGEPSRCCVLLHEKKKMRMTRAVFDMACIQRDNPHPYRLSTVSSHRQWNTHDNNSTVEEDSSEHGNDPSGEVSAAAAASNTSCHVEDAASTKLHLLQYQSGDIASSSAALADQGPFALSKPPLPRSVRVTIRDMNVKQLLGQVLACLSPEYGFAILNDVVLPNSTAATHCKDDAKLQAQQVYTRAQSSRLQVQYEAAIRAYYVYQKHSKYCLRLNRYHKSTYAQLYLTYGSIKVRCYSNDCYDRCLYVSWHSHTETIHANAKVHGAGDPLPNVPGYPCYALLHAIQGLLFPPLPTEELVRRYGMNVLAST